MKVDAYADERWPTVDLQRHDQLASMTWHGGPVYNEDELDALPDVPAQLVADFEAARDAFALAEQAIARHLGWSDW